MLPAWIWTTYATSTEWRILSTICCSNFWMVWDSKSCFKSPNAKKWFWMLSMWRAFHFISFRRLKMIQEEWKTGSEEEEEVVHPRSYFWRALEIQFLTGSKSWRIPCTHSITCTKVDSHLLWNAMILVLCENFLRKLKNEQHEDDDEDDVVCWRLGFSETSWLLCRGRLSRMVRLSKDFPSIKSPSWISIWFFRLDEDEDGDEDSNLKWSNK